MADCNEIDAALARLSGKIDGLNGRLNDLERKQNECCDKKQDTKDNSLEGILRRIAAIENYINKLDTEINLVTDKVKDIGSFLTELFDTADAILGKLFGSITLFTNLFKLFK